MCKDPTHRLSASFKSQRIHSHIGQENEATLEVEN